jgi:putative endonuclease
LRDKGRIGEEGAVKYLKSLGYRIVETNYSARYGEIDIVAVSKGTLVFAEVKTRATGTFGDPWSAVDLRKQRRIEAAARDFIMRRKVGDVPMRFDVVTATPGSGGWEYSVIENAFEARE